MKKKNIAYAAYTAVALCLCAIPAAALPFTETDQTAENRTLAEMPSLTNEDGAWNTQWGSQFEDYFSDHFAFRSDMVSTYDRLSADLLQTSAQDDVIIGKEGWLYYTPTVDDYINQSHVTSTGAKHMAETLSMMNDYAEACGAKLIFTAAPNKNSVYGEYMPTRYVQSEQADTLSLLESSLALSDVSYCDLRSVLTDAAATEEIQLYHKWDTHWNNCGAWIAYDALMNCAGISHTDYTDISYTMTQDWEGDLYKILYPTSEEKDFNYVYDYDYSYTYAGRFRSVDDLTIRTQSETGEHSLLMLRDSFGRALLPFFAEDFASAVFQRGDHLPIDTLESTYADTVIVELAERNLSNLLGYAPQMPAPEVQIPDETEVADSVRPTLAIEKSGNYLHLYGTFDSSYAAHDGIYVAISSESGRKHTYRAFPCYEYALLGEDAPQDNGYSLFVPLEDLDASISTVEVVAFYEDSYIDLGTAGQFQLGAN
jgi:hypothetical protein